MIGSASTTQSKFVRLTYFKWNRYKSVLEFQLLHFPINFESVLLIKPDEAVTHNIDL